jgi:hypothetical protein
MIPEPPPTTPALQQSSEIGAPGKAAATPAAKLRTLPSSVTSHTALKVLTPCAAAAAASLASAGARNCSPGHGP